MRNPLHKRLFRELKSEFSKYAVIFILMLSTISFVSGFLVADGSMITAYNESFTKYNIEDGHFHLAKAANRAQRKAMQSLGITLYDQYFIEEDLTDDSTLRIFAERQEVNRVCLMEGAMPETPGEIAIDRMYADNNGLRPGDMLHSGNHSWIITGLVALSDYSCLFSDNNDSMFDSLKFGVSIVTEEEFSSYDSGHLTYCYAWKYQNTPSDEAEERDAAEELMKSLANQVSLTAFVPRYQNQAIQFAGEDMGSDRAMMIVLLYIIIVIMAFVFGVTTNNTISRESTVIGTLRASGYTRSELIWHYMSTPLLVTLLGAIVGNILGYTILKEVCVGMYYGSYSLPTYVTIWNAEAFLLTTIVPLLMMLCINFFLLWRKMRLSPLKFLRRDLRQRRQQKALRLSVHIPFFSRFRLRIIFQNAGNYLLVFVGILFANLLLMFGLVFPPVLDHYQEQIADNLLSEYQYLLQLPLDMNRDDRKLESLMSMMMFVRAVETENKTAEKFSVYSLNTIGGPYKSEEVLLYGIEPDSRYVSLDTGDSQVYISSSYADKFSISPGDTITLRERYEEDTYTFTVTGIYDYIGSLSIFMSRQMLNETFDMDRETFAGYFADTEITDIAPEYISTVIDVESLTKISRQLTISMGGMMYMVDGFAILIFIVLIYLLSKIIIEKNAQSISMAKILGYTDGEISRLYIVSTSLVVTLSVLLSLPIEQALIEILFRTVMISSISGWIPLYLDPYIYVKTIALGLGTYALVAALEYRRIRKVPMDMALKNVE